MLSLAFRTAARRLQVPVSATIELLSPCNLRCVHCYVTHAKKTALRGEALYKLIDDLAAAGTMTLTLTGGEIGLRKDLYDIIAYARAKHFEVRLLSSGTRWEEKDWDRIAELGVAGVRFSLYGSCDHVHESVTLVDGSFERTVASAKALKARGLDVAFSCSVMHLNAHDIGNILELGEREGIEVVIDPQIVHTDAGDKAPAQTRATFEQLVTMYGDARVRALYYAEDPCASPDKSLKPCGVGDKSVFIRSTGEVFPCSRWPIAGGNVLETPVLDIFRHSAAFQDTRALTFAKLSGCSGCGDAGVCNPCAAINVQESGTVSAPADSICLTTAARATAFHGASKQQRSFRASLPIVA